MIGGLLLCLGVIAFWIMFGWMMRSFEDDNR